MSLHVETRKEWDGSVIVKMAGDLVIGKDSELVESEIVELLDESPRAMVVDLADLEHIDSTGVGILAFCNGKACEHGSPLRVAGAKGAIREIFRVTSVDTLMPFHASTEDALQAIRAGG